MYRLPRSIEEAIARLSQLPGVGPKSASRLAFYLVKNRNFDVASLAKALENLREGLGQCRVCHNIADSEVCPICEDEGRDASLLCVVEEAWDVLAIERAGFRGRYHVLGGQLSPLQGVGPDDLQIPSLVQRVGEDKIIEEVIIATNPDVEGEATASYLLRVLGPANRKVTRLARGLPMGGELEYADELTLARALEGRNSLTV